MSQLTSNVRTNFRSGGDVIRQVAPPADRTGPIRAFVIHAVAALAAASTLVAVVALAFKPGTTITYGAIADVADSSIASGGDPMIGAQLFANTCATCHGIDGHGMPEQGVPLRGSVFVTHTQESQLAAFLRIGRPAGDRATLTGRLMPPRGGNARLTDQDLSDIASYLKTLQNQTVAASN